MFNVKNEESLENEDEKKLIIAAQRKRAYMCDYRARKRETEKKSTQSQNFIPQAELEEKVDFESFVPFSTIVLTNRIQTPKDLLVRGHCKREKTPRKTPKTTTQRTRAYRLRKKLRDDLQPLNNNTNVSDVTSEPIVDSTNALQFGYVVPQTNISGAPILLPFPVTNASQINLNDLPNLVLPQPSIPGQSFLLPTPSVTSTTSSALQIGNLSELFPVQNIVVPQTSVPGPSYLLPVSSVNSTTSNALQIGNLGQVLLIENKVLPQMSISEPPPLVLLNGNQSEKSGVSQDTNDPTVQDYDDLIPSLVTIGEQNDDADEEFDKPEYWHPGDCEAFSKNCEKKEEKGDIHSNKIVLDNVKCKKDPYQQFLDERRKSPCDFIGIKEEYDGDINEVFIKEEASDEM